MREGTEAARVPTLDTMTTLDVERHHWLATFVGLLDSAFYLDDAETYHVADIFGRLLTLLRIPERGEPDALSPAVYAEVYGGHFSAQAASRTRNRQVRAVNSDECFVSLEGWREALLRMLTTAYPALSVDERLTTTKVLTDLLTCLGVPARAAAFHPDSVLEAYREIDHAMR